MFVSEKVIFKKLSTTFGPTLLSFKKRSLQVSWQFELQGCEG